MSVILAATALANMNGNFSPQHVNNWSVEIHGLSSRASGPILNGSDSLTFSLARGFLPTIGADDVEIPFGNESVHVAGRVRYEGGTLEIRDYVDVDIQGVLADWYSVVYGGIRGVWGAVGVPKAYKRNADLLLAAPDGSSGRQWSLEGLWPVQMNFGNLDMASSEQVLVAVSMRYDRAQYMGNNPSVRG